MLPFLRDVLHVFQSIYLGQEGNKVLYFVPTLTILTNVSEQYKDLPITIRTPGHLNDRTMSLIDAMVSNAHMVVLHPSKFVALFHLHSQDQTSDQYAEKTMDLINELYACFGRGNKLRFVFDEAHTFMLQSEFPDYRNALKLINEVFPDRLAS